MAERRSDGTRTAVEVGVLALGVALIGLLLIAATVYRPDREPYSPEELEARGQLKAIHAEQLKYFRRHAAYAPDLKTLAVADATDRFDYRLSVPRAGRSFRAYAAWKEPGRGRFLRIDEEGWITSASPPVLRKPMPPVAPPPPSPDPGTR